MRLTPRYYWVVVDSRGLVYYDPCRHRSDACEYNADNIINGPRGRRLRVERVEISHKPLTDRPNAV